jgi:hypothetical protein
VTAVYGVHRAPPEADVNTVSRVPAVLVIGVLLLGVGAALTQSSLAMIRDANREGSVREVAVEWAAAAGWELVDVRTQAGKVIVRFEGAPPLPDAPSLGQALAAAGIDPSIFAVELVPRVTVDLADTTAR